MNRSDRRGGKPITRVAISGRCIDWLPARGFHHGPERQRSTPEAEDTTAVWSSSAQLLRRDLLRDRDREPSFKGAESTCLFLTEESRYGLLDRVLGTGS